MNNRPKICVSRESHVICRRVPENYNKVGVFCTGCETPAQPIDVSLRCTLPVSRHALSVIWRHALVLKVTAISRFLKQRLSSSLMVFKHILFNNAEILRR